MAKLDARFNGLDAVSHSFNNQVMFDRTNRSVMMIDPKNKSLQIYDTENTRKLQVNFNMGGGPNHNKSLLEHYRSMNEANDENEMASESKMFAAETDSNYHNQSQQILTSIQRDNNRELATPLYAKNPNMSNNKMCEILEISRENKNNSQLINRVASDDRYVQPSPSGITRCYVKYEEPVKSRPIVHETIQVNYQRPAVNKHLLGAGDKKVDCSTSPFVFMNSSSEKQTQVKESKHSVVDQREFDKIVEPVRHVNAHTSISVGDLEQEEKKVVKEPKKLEKSKVVFVNLTPRPTSIIAESINPKNENLNQESIIKNNNSFLNEQTEFSIKYGNHNQNLDSALAVDPTVTFADPTTNLADNINDTNYVDHTFMQQNKSIETPVSAKKFKQADRLKSIVEEGSEKLECNQMLNKKSISYYDNVIKTDQNETTNSKPNNCSVYSTDYNPPLETNFGYTLPVETAPQAVENIEHMSFVANILQQDQQVQFPSPNQDNLVDCETYDNFKQTNGGLKRYELCSIEENNDNEIPTKSIKTYYDGKRCWTSLANSRSTYDNQNFELNEGYDPSNERVKNAQLDTSKDESDGKVKKTNMHVKIRLPDETVKTEISKSKKKRGQHCCFSFTLIIIFFIVIVILGYFIGCDKDTRELLFSREFWSRWKMN